MSQMAQRVEKAARELRAKASRRPRTQEAAVADQDNDNGIEGVPEEEIYPGEVPGEDSAAAEAGPQKEQTNGMAKKQTAAKGGRKGAAKNGAAKGGAAKGGARKAAAAPRAAKGAAKGGEKKERKSRIKTVSGALLSIKPQGTTYLALEFEEGKIVLTPTSNREPNRDLALKALKALLKG
jgi:hypothetical protein